LAIIIRIYHDVRSSECQKSTSEVGICKLDGNDNTQLTDPTHQRSLRYISIFFFYFSTFCWPCISVYLSQYLTNLMHKVCFTVSFISCLYMFRAHVLVICFTVSFISCLYMFRAHVLETCTCMK